MLYEYNLIVNSKRIQIKTDLNSNYIHKNRLIAISDTYQRDS